MMKHSTLRLAGLVAVAASALAMSAPAFAQSADGAVSVTVSYRDLDLGHAQGLQVLKNRVEAAAVQACGGEFDVRDLGRRAIVKKCRADAVEHALAQLSVTTRLASNAPTGSGH
jgi:UrcA family protein